MTMMPLVYFMPMPSYDFVLPSVCDSHLFCIDLMIRITSMPTEAQLEEVHLQRPERCYKNVQPEIEARV